MYSMEYSFPAMGVDDLIFGGGDMLHRKRETPFP
jgi:hypothetical protein